ncbi:TonB-dependent receptor [Dysgonomonas sp. 520]|uniref:SusC/RagA family TonB-linked outer membrane protein n=1 Tax=Dysgonomonas sp. 520 TaxID=2302931 RepID=UPI0013D48B40|nr:TonB-dependent receptor [Dysgonomonas sp. 520]NDW08726.1 TonB-dependent receptor [Dysgonomonas sp. 520]
MKKVFPLLFFLFLTRSLFAQDSWQVSGVVTSADDGEPLIGVTIIVKGEAGLGTTTDFDGKYSIKVPNGKALTFSYMGYQEQTTKTIKSNSTLNITMENDVLMLQEVVAIGYGTMKKSDLTGAVASVKADQLQKTPAAGIDQALQGRVAGVTVNANSGQPGAAAEVRIRGIGTVNNSAPIYVVDGIILENITFLSPNDIESTEILKDASATAIYGSRGANGVIIVTTKKGKSGKSVISLNTYWGVQNRWKKLDLMKRDEFAETLMRINPQPSSIARYQNRGFNAWMSGNTGGSPYFPLIKTDANPYGMDYSSVETDWQDEVFEKNALIQNYHLSVTGGTDISRYAISGSYFNQKGTISGSDYERFTLRVNTSHQVRSWLKIGENLSFMSSEGRNAMNNSSSPGASVISAALAMAPWDPTHYPEGSVNNRGKDLSGQISASSNFKNAMNPFSMVERYHPSNKVERWVGDIYLELTPIKNLTLRSAVSLDLSHYRDKMFLEAYRYSDFDKADKNFLSSGMSREQTLIFENTATYSADIKKHSFSAMIGQTAEERNLYGMGGSGASILNPTKQNWYLLNTTEDRTYSSDSVERDRMFSLLGRLHYSYDSRYLITANFRADGSSKFPNNLWGYFPSTALAWRISEENFMKNISWLDFLKVRAGWGRIGNDKVPSDSFVLTMTQGSNVFTGYPFGPNQELANGAAILTYVNKGGKWETTEQWSAGVDFGFFRGLLGGNVDFFIRDTKDMLLGVKAPAHVGNRFDPIANVGTVRNKGIEISLDHQNKIADIKYSIGGNISFIHNELTALNGGNPVYGDRVLSDKGLGLFTIWGYEYEGIYKSDEEAEAHLFYYKGKKESGVGAGDAKFKDHNGDGKIDDADKTDLGNPFPWLTYGINIGAEYKGFDLQMFFQGVAGNKIYNAVRHRTEGTGSEATLSTTMRNVWIDYSDQMKSSMESQGVDWTKLINREGTIPNPNGSTMNKETSSRFVESGAYMRLKNLQLGYTIPKKLTQKFQIDRCRVYVSASNLFTITDYSGYDPEVGGGVDYGNYPQSRTFMFGLNLDF